MKYIITIALLVVANAADAAPKASFACTLTDLQQWSAPNAYTFDTAIVIAARMSCHNDGVKSVRIKAADVFLLNTDDQKYSPDRDRDAFDAIFEDEDPGPAYVGKFIDIAKGETVDFAFTFTGGNGLTDPHLTLDIDGTKYAHARARGYDPNQ